ncbi:hypothetical protein APUTEX25_001144, partial [Auxenochlorella protothecoides]
MLARGAILPLFLAFAVLACPATASAAVQVTLYGESLCPYCRAWILEQASDLFDQGFSSYIEFRYVAWGNAHRSQDGPQCQHGAAECAGNDLINCAQALYPAQALWFPYVRCLARTGTRAPVAGSDACAASSGLAASALIECARGDRARRLAAAAREATAALRPRHEGVPWVLVNGVALGDHAELVRSYVCAAVPAGAPRPAACFDPPTSAAARATPGLLRLAWRGVLGRWWAPAAW